jgi:hypothetical protein
MKLGTWLVQKFSRYLLQNVSPSHSYLCDFSRIRQEVRPADVLLVEGRNRISRMVRRITQSPWSHAALYIGHIYNVEDPKLREHIQQHYNGPMTEPLLVEAIIGQGTIIVPMSKYKNEHIRVCRPHGLSHDDAQKVISYALNSMGRTYNIRHFIDLGRFILSSKFIPRNWHSSLFQKSKGKAKQDICSVMLAKAFASVKFPILPLIQKNDEKQLEMIKRNPRLYAPSDFDYSPYFEIIKYPMIPVSGFNAYHFMPWKENVMSNDDRGLAPSNEE